MLATGYVWRLYEHFASTPTIFVEHEEYNAEQVAEWTAQTVPAAYLTYKGKCFVEHAWRCSSEHKHVREIVSAATDPARKWLSDIARCIRIVHRALVHKTTDSFMLWNQSAVPATADVKVRHLQVHPRTPGVCPCGVEFNCVQMAKVDATAFFTLANRARCLAEIDDSIRAFEAKGCKGAILHKEIKSIGKILQGKRKTPRTHRLISFEDIRRTLRFLEYDRFFTTGEVVWERLDGLAMGSAPSPPSTAFDLDHHSRLVYTDKKAAKPAGLFIPGVKTTKVVQAMLHVDDCIYFSKIHCSSCLGRIAAKIWPKDVAPKLEAAGQSIE